MFTGIIEEKGSIIRIKKEAKSGVIEIRASKILEDIHIGDSIAVNGVCLTVISFTDKSFQADVMPETWNRSTLGTLKSKSPVNLERAMAANGRFGGHIVAGHIDGTGQITEVKKDSNAVWYTISASEKIMGYIIEKGSIAIDGISLTVASVDIIAFKVSIIPHTLQETTLEEKGVGDIVNLENDLVGKYVERLLGGNPPLMERKPESITMDFLRNHGF